MEIEQNIDRCNYYTWDLKFNLYTNHQWLQNVKNNSRIHYPIYNLPINRKLSQYQSLIKTSFHFTTDLFE